MTTATQKPRYRVLGCNDEQTTCDFCGREHLKKTVILEDTTETNGGDIVRVGTSCAIKACAVPGVRTKAQMDRKIGEANAEIRQWQFSYTQAVEVLADPGRISANWYQRRNAPSGKYGEDYTIKDERASWIRRRDEAAAELARRGVVV